MGTFFFARAIMSTLVGFCRTMQDLQSAGTREGHVHVLVACKEHMFSETITLRISSEIQTSTF